MIGRGIAAILIATTVYHTSDDINSKIEEFAQYAFPIEEKKQVATSDVTEAPDPSLQESMDGHVKQVGTDIADSHARGQEIDRPIETRETEVQDAEVPIETSVTGVQETELPIELRVTEVEEIEVAKEAPITEEEETEVAKEARVAEVEETESPIETRVSEVEETERPIETSAAGPQENEVPIEARATETQETERPIETSVTEAKETEVPIETSVTEVQETEVPIETSVTEVQETEVPIGTSVTEVQETEVPIETSVTEVHETEVPIETSVTGGQETDVPIETSVAGVQETERPIETHATKVQETERPIETHATKMQETERTIEKQVVEVEETAMTLEPTVAAGLEERFLPSGEGSQLVPRAEILPTAPATTCGEVRWSGVEWIDRLDGRDWVWLLAKELVCFFIGWLVMLFYKRREVAVHEAANDTLSQKNRVLKKQLTSTEADLKNIEADRGVLQEKLAKAKATARRMAVEERHNYPIPNHLFPHLRQINVCVTGPSGGGKSSLINALLDRCEGTSGAASVGLIETTKKPIAFVHPEFPDVVLWDCPGVGTRNYPQETYVRNMGLKHFSCVLIVSSTRFTENDHMLRAELERVRLPYFCIRSKFDQDCDNLLKNINRNRPKGDVLSSLPREIERTKFDEIKDDLRNEQNIRLPYILSSFEKNAYDFPKFLRNFRARLTRFSEERPPMLSCEVCGAEEDPVNRALLCCCHCRYFVCASCIDIVPYCETCPNCKRAASYGPLGEQDCDDSPAESEDGDGANFLHAEETSRQIETAVNGVASPIQSPTDGMVSALQSPAGMASGLQSPTDGMVSALQSPVRMASGLHSPTEGMVSAIQSPVRMPSGLQSPVGLASALGDCSPGRKVNGRQSPVRIGSRLGAHTPIRMGSSLQSPVRRVSPLAAYSQDRTDAQSAQLAESPETGKTGRSAEKTVSSPETAGEAESDNN